MLHKRVVESLDVPPEWIEAIDAKERRELERRERVYRGDRPPPDVAGKTVILVDDGLATGSTMLAAIYAIRADDPVRVVVAVPLADAETAFLLDTAQVRGRRLERAIAVVYRPETERISHYFNARLADQFDAESVMSPPRAARAGGRPALPRSASRCHTPRPGADY